MRASWIASLGLTLALWGCQSVPPPDRAEPAPDPELAAFDVSFPWPAFQWMNRTLELNPDHNGSESWADHLGLAGYHDNSIKARRRAVMNALTFGFAQDWYDARGLGSPPDQ
jgi:hypothetical protein